MRIPDEWWSSPTESENGRLIIVTGRRDVEPAIETGEFNDRIEITWKYSGEANGMPDKETSMQMEAVTNALQAAFKNASVAVMTGIYTGDDERNWVFYVRKLEVFGKVFNKALSEFPLLPITLYAEKDPEWSEYREMKDLSYIDAGE